MSKNSISGCAVPAEAYNGVASARFEHYHGPEEIESLEEITTQRALSTKATTP
jgi:hypothetical protein